jgi:hypothetical protein
VSSESEQVIDDWYQCLAPRTRNNLLLSGLVNNLTPLQQPSTPKSPFNQQQQQQDSLGNNKKLVQKGSGSTGNLTATLTDITTASSTPTTTATQAVGVVVTSKQKKKTMDIPASKPMHRQAQASFLSSSESNKQDYRGMFNLAGLILLVSNIRMFLKNFLVYGLLLQFAIPATFNKSNPSVIFFFGI